jgi:DNA-binding CsgD family transcriptional regulator
MAIITAVLYFYFFNRIKRIEKRNTKLEKLVKERSEEILKQQEILRLQESEKTQLLIRQKELEANNLKAEKELITLRNQKLEDELEDQKSEIFKRNNELAASSLQLNQKIEFLTHLKSYLKELHEKSSDQDKKLIANLVNQIEKDNSLKKEWEQFEFHFDKANNNYFKKLKELYPDLTIKDLQMCSYLRLNLSNKEIANMLNISIRGVEKSRSRLRKKMNLESDTNLAEFLIKL